MTSTGHQCDPGSGPEPKRSGFAEGLIHAAWIIPTVAVLVIILFLVLGHAQWSNAWVHFLSALVYSAMIGGPSAVLLNWFSHRYTGRLGRWVVVPQILILVCTATLGSLAAAVILQLTHVVRNYGIEFRYSYPFAIVLSLVVGLSVTSYETLRHRLVFATLELRTRQVEQERAYKLLAEARLSSLESRIHPHFLFNTLNSIAALIPSDPRRAEDTVAKLASLLRFSLTANQNGLVPLAQELKIVRDYLEIESTRFGNRLHYTIDAQDSPGDIKVPPLALQTLVENAVKHVVAQRPEGGVIQISAARDGANVRLEVIDNGPGFSLDAVTPEHGLGNLIARLELLFGGRGKLDAGRRDDSTVVSVAFPAEK
jgi:two-component system sensor histidine kinase AlgZ